MSHPNEIAEFIADVRESVLYFGELGAKELAVQLAEPSLQTPTVARQERSSHDVNTEIRQGPPPEIKVSAPPPPQQRRAGARVAVLPKLKDRNRPEPVSALSDHEPTPQIEVLKMAAAPETNESAVAANDYANESIDDIRNDIGNCTRCQLHAGRSQIVHSTGNREAELMFVGEAPGADEDMKGEPFVGRAGQLLTKIIEAIGFNRDDVFIGNINRCRPPGNRQPMPEEAAVCRPYILREVAVVKPKVIVVLGAHAAHNLLQVKTPISKLRGEFHDYFGVKVMPTFHPAYLLRDPNKKREVWDDMKKVRAFLSGEPPP